MNFHESEMYFLIAAIITLLFQYCWFKKTKSFFTI